MMKVIENYRHLLGKHCISTALMNYANYNSIPMTEAMAFGLDCSLGFCYRKYDELSKIPAFYTGGRTYSWITNFSDVLGVHHKRITSPDRDYGWSLVRDMIDHNIPALVELDKSKLDYWKGTTREVPFHMVVVIGYDLDKVLLGDVDEERINSNRLSNNLHITSIEGFKDSRNTSFQWGKIENAVHNISPPDIGMIDMKRFTKEAIKRNTSDFLYGEEGYKNLEFFAEELPYWNEVLPISFFDATRDKKVSPLRYQLLITGKMLDEIGTGGGNFRTLYSKFLFEASDIWKSSIIYESAELILESSKEWSEIGRRLCKISRMRECDIRQELIEVQKSVRKCIEYENKAFNSLEKWGMSNGL